MSDGFVDDRDITGDSDETVQFGLELPKKLREDAKRNTNHGEITEEVRNTFRRLAYGPEARQGATELDRLEAELQEVRHRVDELRRERSDIDTEIQAHEARATRLEERISSLERRRSELDTKLETLENMLIDGQRWWPTRIKNAVNVDISTAEKLHQQLQEQNAELPDVAFTEPGLHEDADWRVASE